MREAIGGPASELKYSFRHDWRSRDFQVPARRAECSACVIPVFSTYVLAQLQYTLTVHSLESNQKYEPSGPRPHTKHELTDLGRLGELVY